MKILLWVTFPCLLLAACALMHQSEQPLRARGAPEPAEMLRVLPRLESVIRGMLVSVERKQQSVAWHLAGSQFYPAAFKSPLALRALTDPWSGLADVERQGRQIAGFAASGNVVWPALVDALETGMGWPVEIIAPETVPTGTHVDDHLRYIGNILKEANRLRSQAIHGLNESDRRFIFERAAAVADHYIPQLSAQSETDLTQARGFSQMANLVDQRMKLGGLMAAAKVLAQLDNLRWLDALQTAIEARTAQPEALIGVEGDLLLVHETPWGLLVIGGYGANRYALDARFAVVIDLGGDDTYEGTIAANANVGHGVSVVIDLSGNDRYFGSPLGLATGRLGVGLLIDGEGDDLYHLPPGTGGVGLAGVGILHDHHGHDRYIGSRFTQGAAFAGLGLVLDGNGYDTYRSFGYALGFGGPLGVGAVIDMAGDDSYQCGGAYPSGYNRTDAPEAKAGDPNFQFDAFGIGAGVGLRLLSRNPEHLAYGLAGGWGLMIDLNGNDTYRSGNFSQAVGYFFGIGMKLDLAGRDEHIAARYGHGTAAHYGVGLFIDDRGDDRYGSTGPLYNAGTAWDLSVSLCLDADNGDDVYDFSRSDGLGRADHRSWSFFIEEGGRDRYLVSHGMGVATDHSLSGFIDLAGEDDYAMSLPAGGAPRGNKLTHADTSGGVFIDR